MSGIIKAILSLEEQTEVLASANAYFARMRFTICISRVPKTAESKKRFNLLTKNNCAICEYYEYLMKDSMFNTF